MSNIFDLFKKIEKPVDNTPVSFIIAGLTKNLWISLGVGLVLLLGVLFFVKKLAENSRKKEV